MLNTWITILSSGGAGVLGAIIAIMIGLFWFVMLYASAESLNLSLAVEENTRLTAALLLRMHQESQPEPRSGATYSTTYASEPFEG